MSAIRPFAAALLITAWTSARADLPPSPGPPQAPAATPAGALAPTPTPALAQAPAPTQAPATAPPSDRPALLGLQLGAGIPDGLALSVAFRPYTSYLRLDAGLAWDYFGLGLRGGVTFLPLHARLTPTLTFEGGSYFAANLQGTLSRLNIPDIFKDASRSVGMSYVAGMVGLEVGGPDGLLFFVRAGITRVWFSLPASSATNLTAGEMTAGATLPAAVVGVALYLW